MAATPITLWRNYDESDETKTDAYDYKAGEPLPTIEDIGWEAPSGKRFKEWNSSKDGSGTAFQPGDLADERSWNLSAIWEEVPVYLATDTELASVADAIRSKSGTSESLAFPTDFVSAIANIPSGGNIEEDGNGNLTFSTDGNVIGKIPLTISAGGTYTPPAGKAYSAVEVNIGGNKPSKDVNFRDYDGTIVNSYTKEEFLALTAMPANPSHDGLTAQGWNWSFADAQAYVTKYGRLEVGQMYITDDGKTRVYIHLEQGRTSPMLGVCPNGTVDVDWGDGTAHDTLTGTGTTTVQWTPNHAYAAPGDYVIKLTVTGSMGFYGNNSSNQYSGLLRYSSSGDGRNYAYRDAIQRIEIGSGVTSIGSNAFNVCYSLASVTIPDSVTSIGSNAFNVCYSLASVTIPDSVTSISGNALYNCYSLASVTIPDSVTSISSSAFYNCYSLASVTIPDSVTSISGNAFYNCYSLASVTIPDSVTSISGNTFNNCYSLASVTIPDSVTSISSSAFYNCYSVAKYHLAPTTPPALSGTSAFTGIAADCIIYVPYSADHSILEAYKTATNWSTYASYIQEEPV